MMLESLNVLYCMLLQLELQKVASVEGVYTPVETPCTDRLVNRLYFTSSPRSTPAGPEPEEAVNSMLVKLLRYICPAVDVLPRAMPRWHSVMFMLVKLLSRA